jgi:hypothetical protein
MKNNPAGAEGGKMNCYANMIRASLVLVMLSFRISALCSHDVEFIIVPCRA